MQKYIKGMTLAILMTFLATMIPSYNVVAEEKSTSNIEKSSSEQDTKLDGLIVGEVTEKRDENIKHFIKEDLSYEAVIYNYPVHYMENGEWKDIDNTLEDSTDESFKVQEQSLPDSAENSSKAKKVKKNNNVIKNKNNGFEISFSKNSNSNKLVKLEKGGYELSWGIEKPKNTEAQIIPIDEVKVDNSIVEEASKEIETNSKYKALATDKKEKVKNTLVENEKKKTLEKTSSSMKYSNIYDDVDLKYDLLGDLIKENIIINKPKENLEINFQLNTKGLVGKLQKDKSIVFYDKKDESKAVFKMNAPFMIDGNNESSDNIELVLKESEDGYILSIKPDSKWLNDSKRVYPVNIDPPVETSLSINSIEDTFVCSIDTENKYRNILLRTGIINNVGVMRSYMKFTLPQLNPSDMITDANLNLYVHEVQNGGVQVNAHKVTNNWSSSSMTWGNKPSYDPIVENYEIINSTGWRYMDITSIAKDWYNNQANYGLMLKNNAESSGTVAFRSSDTTDTNARPSVTINYISNAGLENYWTYHSQDIGRAGTGYVNDYNGNLIFAHDDVSMTGNKMPVNINHVYNSTDGTQAKNVGYGQGWRLNLSQTIEEQTFANGKYYVYTDEDGTKHYFKQNGSNTFQDELNLGLTLTKNGDGTFYIKDKGSNMLFFNSNRTLSSIRDANNNSININYDAQGKINKVTDGVGRITTLTYETINGAYMLKSIKEPSGRTTSFGYSGVQLWTITYADGKVSEYKYEANNKLKEVINCDGYKMLYSYYGNNKVSSIKETTTSGTAGQQLSISYGDNITTFTDYLGKRSMYIFDDNGVTTSIKDPQGNATYYKYEDGLNKTKLTTSSKVQKTIVNLLRDHNAEFNNGAWVYGNDIGVGQGGFVTNEKYLGQQSLKLSKTDKSGGNYYDQTIKIEKGKTYTFSAYAKISNVSTAQGTGAGVEIIYKDKSGNSQFARSNKINGDTTNWDRLQATFELPSDAQSDQIVVRISLVEAAGSVYFDCMQLEESSVANRYNLIENQDADGSSSSPYGWSAQGWSPSQQTVTISDSKHPINLNNNVFKIDGDAFTTLRKFNQRINISGKKGDAYTLAAWAKADSVPKGKFAIEAIINSSTPQIATIKFNNDSSEWQYLSDKFIANNDYSSIDIYLIYESNANTAYFDGIQLYKEEFGDSYQYDSKGNVVSTSDLNKQQSTFEYDGNNDLIKSVDPKGSQYKYEYDTRHNIIKATSAGNIITSFDYSESGNPYTTQIGDGLVSTRSYAEYDSQGNYIKSITDELGNSVKYDYDSTKGVLNSSTDAKGSATSYQYDIMDKLQSVSKTVNGSTISNSYTYENDKIKTITHNGFSYNFGYDALGNNTTVSVGSQNLITNTYDTSRNLLNATYGNGHTIGYDYDGQDRISGIKVKGEKNIGVTYSSHVTNEGWQTYKSDSQQSGTIDDTKMIQALKIKLIGEASGIKVKYQAHVQNIGWQDWVYDDSQAGTTGLDYRMEAIKIKLEGAPKGYRIRYQAYVKGIGWMDPVENGEMAGTMGLALPIEAIKIDVSKVIYSYKYDGEGNLANKSDLVNDVTYKYIYDTAGRLIKEEDSKGNTLKYDYDKNNNSSKVSEKINGKSYDTNYSYDKDNRPQTVSYNRDSTNSNINYIYNSLGKISRKAIDLNSGQFTTIYNYNQGNSENTINIGYKARVQNNGWQSEVINGDLAGTTGKNLNIEGLTINLRNTTQNIKIKYQAHVQDIGWQDWGYDGSTAGTEAQGKRIEAIKIQLEGAPQGYHVKYQAHVAEQGWQDWVQDGEIAGTTGKDRAIQALRIIMVKDGAQGLNDTTLSTPINNRAGISYSTHVQDKGWDTVVKQNGEIGGITGESLKIEAIKMNLINAPTGATLQYNAYIQNKEWQGWKNAGEVAGTEGQNLRMEAIKITLNNAPGYHVEYQVYVTGDGWQKAVKDGEQAGTTLQNKSIEAIRINIVKDGDKITNRVYSITNGNKTINYTYNQNGNIERIIQDGKTTTYQYNELNELIREDNEALGKTTLYNYDAGGNITSKREYAYTNPTSVPATVVSTIAYGYGDSNWKDKLTSYNGSNITYDQIGNPLTYGGYTYTWEQGRQLKGISGNSKTIAYKYDDSGIRTEKTVNGVVTKYHLVGDKVTYEETGSDKIYYTYGSDSDIVSMNLNGVEYYYIRNLQGDIIGLIDKAGTQVVSYSYDSWGKLISIEGNLKDSVGVKNPYRYRGYRYDNETGMYYLKSRYYNPEWGRFINADGLIGQTGDLLTHNMFAYCKNNPVNMSDSNGDFPWLILIPIATFLTAWITTVVSAPDFQMDVAAISDDWSSGDRGALAIDIACAAIPALPAGGSKISKAVKNSKVIKGTSVVSKKGAIKKAQLPTKGKIRYVPPKKWTPTQNLPMKGNGYLDKFGNVWVDGESRTAGQAFEWDVQLSRTGRSQLGQFTRDGSHLNVSLDGRITHK